MSATPFQKAYSSLNENQKKAVDTIDGPVMVMAGPGTGKTQVLTVRIANILAKTDTDPSAILALTFTEAAAKEMRHRLIDLIGKDGYYVRISTFHSFCNDIILENPERFSRPAGSQAATELEKIRIVTQILDQDSFKLLKPLNSPYLYLKDIISSISALKREGITLKKYARLVKKLSSEFLKDGPSLSKTDFVEQEKLVTKNLDLLIIYEKYENGLGAQGRFDFEDMINWVVEVFESDEEFLLLNQEKFQYILVDEYQDTNSAQNRLIFSLTSFYGDKANLFVVGDANQSIYRFQGASQENTHQFKKHFPRATYINLQENYRSTSTILSAAAALISDPPLSSNVLHLPTSIKVGQFNAAIFEDEFLLDSITDKIKNGVSPAGIAVIAKENKDIEHLVELFKKRGLAYRLGGGTDILSTPLVTQFIKILSLVTNLYRSIDDLDLFTVLNYPYFNLEPLSVLKLARSAHHHKQSLIEVLALPDTDPDLKSTFSLFVNWSHQATTKTLSEMFQIIFQESGLLNHILKSSQPINELNRFNSLFEDIKKQLESHPNLDLFGYIKNLSLMADHGLKLEENLLASNLDAVTLTTAHKSKGLEWLVVYIYRFADTHWGNKSVRQMIKLPPDIIESQVDLGDKNAEEKRLFYVAVTRAKQELHLLGSTTYPSSTKMVFPAMFLSDLPPVHLEALDTTDYDKNAGMILANNLATPPDVTLNDDEANFIRELLTDFKLSPTALNTYLECHYKFKLDNLYRIPRAKAPPMCFGTAVHFALENLYKKLNQNRVPETKAAFLADFESALKRESLTQPEYLDRLRHGRQILSAYYDFNHDSFAPALFTEKNFGRSLPIFLDDIALSGKTDRIDLIDKSNNGTRFIDYKTGAPQTRNEIAGLTKNSHGNYKRQLVFYHLLADLDQTFKYRVADTELDFIEPDKGGRFHRERFQITPTEVDELKATIKTEVGKIRALDFDRTTDTTICTRCDFKSHCWPNGLPDQ